MRVAILAIVVACGLTAAALFAQSVDAPPQFSTSTDLVVLHATVRDRSNRIVTGLSADSFGVREDGVPQRISLFSGEDAPATIGLVMDSSVSMFNIRDLVLAGASAFVSASNPEDQLFALAFNEDVAPVLPPETPFTSDAAVLHESLEAHIAARGRTALFDAVAAGLDYAERGTHDHKVLVVLSDGGDNASHVTLTDIRRRIAASNVVVYSVAIAADDEDSRPAVMRDLASTSGGETFRPKSALEISAALQAIAKDIRLSYAIGYAPTRPADDTFRELTVTAARTAGDRLSVQTRKEYLASVTRSSEPANDAR